MLTSTPMRRPSAFKKETNISSFHRLCVHAMLGPGSQWESSLQVAYKVFPPVLLWWKIPVLHWTQKHVRHHDILYIVPKLSRNRSVPVLKMEACQFHQRKGCRRLPLQASLFRLRCRKGNSKFFFILGIFGAVYCDVRRERSCACSSYYPFIYSIFIHQPGKKSLSCSASSVKQGRKTIGGYLTAALHCSMQELKLR